MFEQQSFDAASLTLDDCIALLNEEIQQDLYLSFPDLKVIEEDHHHWHYTYEEIAKKIGKSNKRDRRLESLIQLFHGSSLGNKHLLVLKNNHTHSLADASRGYIYYKEVNGTNVLLEIKRNKKKWKVVKKRIGRGRYITLRDINRECMISY